MRSQSGTFYKIIVTCLLLGVSHHITLSTGSPAVAGLDSKEPITAETPKDAIVPSGNEALTSASSNDEKQDGASDAASDASANGVADALNSASEKTEGSNKPIVLKEANKEVLLTAAQSYFIEPPTSTTTTQRPTFKKRKTRRPISALTEKKRTTAPVVENENDIPQGNPVPFNPFRQLMNTAFGKSRNSASSSTENKLGLGRPRTRANFTRPGAATEQTGSPINDKINEIPSTTESDARPFNRRRPFQEGNGSTQRPNNPANPPGGPPHARRFPLRKPRPSGLNNNDADNNKAADTSAPAQKTFKRVRPASIPSSPAGPRPGGSQEENNNARRVRPIRPIVGRLANRNPTTTPTTTTSTTTSTTTTEAAPSIPVINEQSPFLLGFPESALLNSINPTANNNSAEKSFSPSPEIPPHISNIINGLAPISILPSKPELDTPRLPPLRSTGGVDVPSSASADGNKQGFVLRPRTRPAGVKAEEGENESATRQVRRRKRPQSTTTEGPVVPVRAEQQQMFRGGIVGDRNNQISSSSNNNNNEGRPSLRGGIPDGAIPRNPRRGSTRTSTEDRTSVPLPASPNRDRGNIRNLMRNSFNPSPPDVSVNERLPVSPRGRGIPSVGIPRNPVNISPVQGGIINYDFTAGTPGNIPQSSRERIPNLGGGIPRNPVTPPPSLRQQGGVIIPDIITGTRGIPSSPPSSRERTPINIPVTSLNTGRVPVAPASSPNLIDNNVKNLRYSGNPIENPMVFRGGIVGQIPDIEHQLKSIPQLPDLEQQIKNIPPLVRTKPIEVPAPLPFPQFPQIPPFTPFPESYQIREQGPFLEPLIPDVNVNINNIPQQQQPLQQPQQPVIKAQSPTLLREAAPLTIQTNPNRPNAPIILKQSQMPNINSNFIRPAQPAPPQIPTTIINNNIRPSPQLPLSAPIQQTLNDALPNPSNRNFANAPPPPGLFQVPPRDNMKIYPGLENVLGVATNFNSVQQRKPLGGRNQFSSRTTLVPSEDKEAEVNNKSSPSASASNENKSVVFAEISDAPPSENPIGDAAGETSQTDYTTVLTTSTTTVATPTKKLSAFQKLHQNRQAAARRFLTPRKPTEKTTQAPSAYKKPVNSLRKSVIPPRTLRTRGKSLGATSSQAESTAELASNSNSGENLSEINNASVQSSSASVAATAADPDTSSNIVPISVGESEQESSSRKPTLLEKAKRRRIPVPNKNSSSNPVQQQQQKQKGGLNNSSHQQQSSSSQVNSEAEAPLPNCEEGHRYSKFLKRCIVMYKPKVQG